MEKREKEKNEEIKKLYNKYLDELKEYTRFTCPNEKRKAKQKKILFYVKEPVEKNFEYYHYEINKNDEFESHIKSITEFANWKFDYDKAAELENINTYIGSLEKLKNDFLSVFEKMASETAAK